MSSAGVEAGEKMLGVSGPPVEVAKASFARHMRIQAKAPRVNSPIREDGFTALCSKASITNGGYAGLFGDGMIAPAG